MNTVKASNGIEIPFPVETPFFFRPHMRPLREDESVLTIDHLLPQYIEEKKKYYGPAYGDNATRELIRDSIVALKKYDSNCPITDLDHDGLVYHLTMSIPEDFVIFANNKSNELSAQVLSVHFPSGWNPKEKANLTFAEIHEPVADADSIKKNSEHIAKMITTKGPFVRHIWSISNSPEFSRHPDVMKEWTTETVEEMWFRCERQVTVPVDGRACLFLIRVYHVPMIEIFENPENRQLIIDSINSMSDAIIEYKNWGYLKNYFNQHGE